MIRYSEQSIDKKDIEGVVQVLTSKHLTQGPLIEAFEEAITELTMSKYAACVSSATAALHLTYLAAGMSKHSLVWTVANTFVATVSAAIHCGAKVDFVDIELKNYSLCEEKLRKKLEESKKIPDFLIVVHFAGRPVDLSKIAPICDHYGIKIIEDASHALGAQSNGQMVGNCKYSLASVFSFHPVKTITTAEGGAVTSNDENLINKIKKLRSHCIENDRIIPWYRSQNEVGFNYRMSELHASLGISQLKKLKEFQKIRQEQAERYFSSLAHLDIDLPNQDTPNSMSSWHLFVIKQRIIDEEMRNRKMLELIKANIGVNLHYFPLYKLKTFEKNVAEFPNNEEYFKTAISIPLNAKMTKNDQMVVIKQLERIYS